MRLRDKICWRTFFIDGVTGLVFLGGIFIAVSVLEAVW